MGTEQGHDCSRTNTTNRVLAGASGGQLGDTGTRGEHASLAVSAATWLRQRPGPCRGGTEAKCWLPTGRGRREPDAGQGHSRVPLAATGEHLLSNSDAGSLLFLQELPTRPELRTTGVWGPSGWRGLWTETDKEEEEATGGRWLAWVCGACGPFSWRGWLPPQVWGGARSLGGACQAKGHLS